MDQVNNLTETSLNYPHRGGANWTFWVRVPRHTSGEVPSADVVWGYCITKHTQNLNYLNTLYTRRRRTSATRPASSMRDDPLHSREHSVRRTIRRWTVVRDIRTHNTFLSKIRDRTTREIRPSCETFAPITHFSRSSKIRDRTTREMRPSCETFAPMPHFSRSSKIRDRTTREIGPSCETFAPMPHFSRSSKIRDRTTREIGPSCETFAPITHFSRSSKIRDRTTREMRPSCETFAPITHFSRSTDSLAARENRSDCTRLARDACTLSTVYRYGFGAASVLPLIKTARDRY